MRKRKSKIEKREAALALSLARGALMADGKTYMGHETVDQLLERMTPELAKNIRKQAADLAMASKPAEDPWSKTPPMAIM